MAKIKCGALANEVEECAAENGLRNPRCERLEKQMYYCMGGVSRLLVSMHTHSIDIQLGDVSKTNSYAQRMFQEERGPTRMCTGAS